MLNPLQVFMSSEWAGIKVWASVYRSRTGQERDAENVTHRTYCSRGQEVEHFDPSPPGKPAGSPSVFRKSFSLDIDNRHAALRAR